MQLTVSTRALGRRKPLLSDFDVEPPGDLDDDGDLHLRELIAHVVRCQVTRFCSRQHARRFDRVLTAGEISDGAMAGKVDPAGKPTDQEVDEDAAISAALQAFEDGLYLVVIDEVERRRLDEPVYLSSHSRIVFLRLTFLAGA